MKRKYIVYIDMDGVLCDYRRSYRTAINRESGIQFPQSREGFFEALDPMPGAIEAMTWLENHDNFDPYILSSPSVKNPSSYSGKRRWVEEFLGFSMVPKLILSKRKDLHIGDILIDDCERGNGQERFTGKLIHFGSNRYPDWSAVIHHLVTFLSRPVIDAELNLVVIRSSQPERTMAFYQLLLEVEFDHHRHGKGPMHYSAIIHSTLLEVYPLRKADQQVDNSTRLGFGVKNLVGLTKRMMVAGYTMKLAPKASPWGLRAILIDPDGRSVELTQAV